MDLHNILFITFFSALITSGNYAFAKSTNPQEKEFHEPLKLKVVSIVSQNNIGAQIIHTNSTFAAGYILGGVIGAGIGAEIDSDIALKKTLIAQRKAYKYNQHTIDFDFHTEAHRALKTALESSSAIKLVEYIPSSNLKDLEIKPRVIHSKKQQSKPRTGYIATHTDEKLLVLNTMFSFDPDLNIIHIDTFGQLYFGKRKNTKSFYNKKLFRIIYQSPSAHIKYALVDEGIIESEIKSVKEIYQLRKIENPKYKKAYERREKYALRNLRIGKYITLTNPIKKHDWNTDNMESFLLDGLSNNSKQLGKAILFEFNKKAMKKNLRKIPIVPAGSKKPKILHGKAYAINNDSNYQTFYFKTIDKPDNKNVYYNLPTQEMLRYPNYLMGNNIPRK